MNAAPITASLVLGAVVMWMAIAVPVGVYSALRPRSAGDRVAMTGVLTGISVHPVWLGLIASYILGYKLDLFPIQGYCAFTGAAPGETCGGPVDWFYHLIVPWTVFAVLYAAFYVRMIRSTVLDTLNEDYVRTARAKGAPEQSRASSSTCSETRCCPSSRCSGWTSRSRSEARSSSNRSSACPASGYVALHSLFQFDYPVTLGVVVFASILVIVFNLIVDLLYAWVDPRIRLA